MKWQKQPLFIQGVCWPLQGQPKGPLEWCFWWPGVAWSTRIGILGWPTCLETPSVLSLEDAWTRNRSSEGLHLNYKSTQFLNLEEGHPCQIADTTLWKKPWRYTDGEDTISNLLPPGMAELRHQHLLLCESQYSSSPALSTQGRK